MGNHYNLDTQPNDTKLDPNLHDCVILHECDHLDALPIRFNRQAWIRITLIKDGNGVLNIGGEALYDTEEVPPKINAKVAVAPHTLSFEDKRFAQDQAQKTGDPTFIGWITSTIAIKKSNSVLDRRT